MYSHLKLNNLMRKTLFNIIENNVSKVGISRKLSNNKENKSESLSNRISKKISDIESSLKSDPNSPLGRIDRTPKRQSNESNGSNEHISEDPFAPFEGRRNPSTGEVGGPTGPEPTRYGDWERKGRVSDF
jgi:hypothetical protein